MMPRFFNDVWTIHAYVVTFTNQLKISLFNFMASKGFQSSICGSAELSR